MCRPVRLFLAALVACAASLSILPAAAGAQSPASGLKLVVTNSALTQEGVRQVVTLRLKNTAPSAFQVPADPDQSLRVVLESPLPGPLSLQVRSLYGWNCEYGLTGPPISGTGLTARRVTCELKHGIEPGDFSIPLEIEVLPFDKTRLTGTIEASATFYAPAPDSLDVTEVDGVTPAPAQRTLNWGLAGLAEYVIPPKAEVTSSTPTLASGELATVAFSATSAGEFSTGAFLLDNELTPLSSPAAPCCFYDPQMILTLPSDKVELVSLVGFAPSDQGTAAVPVTSRAGFRAFDATAHLDERALVPGQDYVEQAPGVYAVTNLAGARFLPNNPYRFIAKVRLKSGVDAATLSLDVEARPERFFGDTLRALRSGGRALFSGPYADSASTTVTRAAVPVPDSGGVQNQTQAPLLTGKARFGDEEITVGKRTTLRVTVTNSGNAPSTAPRVCVRISSHLVVIKVPKGVTVKGSLLCAPLPTIAAGQTVTAAKGIVLRGVRATDKAKVRDGAQEGIPVSGDDLRIVAGQIRAGGVTG